jgi:hypothetical protein
MAATGVNPSLQDRNTGPALRDSRLEQSYPEIACLPQAGWNGTSATSDKFFLLWTQLEQ